MIEPPPEDFAIDRTPQEWWKMKDHDEGHRGADVGDGYKAYSETMSGWKISVNDNAPPERRWRAVHPEFGTKYFDKHDAILEYTVRRVAELAAMLVRGMRR